MGCLLNGRIITVSAGGPGGVPATSTALPLTRSLPTTKACSTDHRGLPCFRAGSRFTVREHLSFALRLRGRPEAEIDRRVAELAGRLGLERLLDRRPAGLSGGEVLRLGNRLFAMEGGRVRPIGREALQREEALA